MSATVLQFTPKAEVGPQANLSAFIELCRRSEVLGARGQFDKHTWDIGHFKGHNKVHRAVFSSMEAASKRASEPCLTEPFMDFSKAALVYLHDRRPVVSQAVRVSALRFLEAALRDSSKGSRPTAVTSEVLDSAVELARYALSAGAAYRVAGQLELIAEMMQSNGFISLRQGWAHGMKKPGELGSRISKEALKARQEKLPSAAALRALGGIFQEATKPSGVLVSSYTALMACAPERINEVLRLKRNCLVKGDGRFLGKLGLRWPGSKGADDTTKWLPTEMAPVAEQAVENLLKVSSPAHELAAWYTKHPENLYLHEHAKHLRDKEVLTVAELALLLWGDEGTKNAANLWARTTKALQKVPLKGCTIGYRFKDVEAAVLSLLPKTFPYVPGAPGLLCKDALGVIRINEMATERATSLCMFTCVGYTTVAASLTGRNGQTTIFEKFKYTEDDGSPILMRSHSLRHYLNMLAQMGGMTSAEIALFSGRKDVFQNRAYDHMSSDEVQEPISRALKTGMTGDLVTKEPTRPVYRRSDFPLANPVAAHTTEYGWCMHDFASEPCQVHRDCLNCEEQECIKGEEQKEDKLRSLKAETEHLLKVAKDALSEAEYGADAWVEHQSKTLERVNSLLAILDDPKVPAGSRIRLNVVNAPLIANSQVKAVQPIKFERRRLLK